MLGMTMADRNGLKIVGFIFATVTLAVMLTTAMVVKGYADGAYSLEGATVASRENTGSPCWLAPVLRACRMPHSGRFSDARSE